MEKNKGTKKIKRQKKSVNSVNYVNFDFMDEECVIHKDDKLTRDKIVEMLGVMTNRKSLVDTAINKYYTDIDAVLDMMIKKESSYKDIEQLSQKCIDNNFIITHYFREIEHIKKKIVNYTGINSDYDKDIEDNIVIADTLLEKYCDKFRKRAEIHDANRRDIFPRCSSVTSVHVDMIGSIMSRCTNDEQIKKAKENLDGILQIDDTFKKIKKMREDTKNKFILDEINELEKNLNEQKMLYNSGKDLLSVDDVDLNHRISNAAIQMDSIIKIQTSEMKEIEKKIAEDNREKVGDILNVNNTTNAIVDNIDNNNPENKELIKVNPVEVNPESINPVEVNPEPINPVEVNPEPINPVEVNPEPINPVEVNPEPINPVEVNPEPINQDLIRREPIQTWIVEIQEEKKPNIFKRAWATPGGKVGIIAAGIGFLVVVWLGVSLVATAATPTSVNKKVRVLPFNNVSKLATPNLYNKEVDDKLKFIFAIVAMELRDKCAEGNSVSWSDMQSILAQCHEVQKNPNEKEINESRTFDGEFSNTNVKTWLYNFLKEKDADVFDVARIYDDEIKEVIDFVQNSSTHHLLANHVFNSYDLLDIGMIRFPTKTEPYIKIYRLQLTGLFSGSSFMTVSRNVSRSISASVYSCKYFPRDDLLDRLPPNMIKNTLVKFEHMLSD
jgi:hypothetical protein